MGRKEIGSKGVELIQMAKSEYILKGLK